MGQEIEREKSLWSFSILKAIQEFYILTEKRSYGRKKFLQTEIFWRDSICKGLLEKAKDLRSHNKVAKVAHDRLIAYKKERGNDISEAQGDP